MDDHQRQLIADLHRHQGFALLREWVTEQRDGYFKNLAAELYAGKPLADADLDYKRGYFKGMFRLLNEANFTAKQIQADLERKDTDE